MSVYDFFFFPAGFLRRRLNSKLVADDILYGHENKAIRTSDEGARRSHKKLNKTKTRRYI